MAILNQQNWSNGRETKSNCRKSAVSIGKNCILFQTFWNTHLLRIYHHGGVWRTQMQTQYVSSPSQQKLVIALTYVVQRLPCLACEQC